MPLIQPRLLSQQTTQTWLFDPSAVYLNKRFAERNPQGKDRTHLQRVSWTMQHSFGCIGWVLYNATLWAELRNPLLCPTRKTLIQGQADCRHTNLLHTSGWGWDSHGLWRRGWGESIWKWNNSSPHFWSRVMLSLLPRQHKAMADVPYIVFLVWASWLFKDSLQ